MPALAKHKVSNWLEKSVFRIDVFTLRVLHRRYTGNSTWTYFSANDDQASACTSFKFFGSFLKNFLFYCYVLKLSLAMQYSDWKNHNTIYFSYPIRLFMPLFVPIVFCTCSRFAVIGWRGSVRAIFSIPTGQCMHYECTYSETFFQISSKLCAFQVLAFFSYRWQRRVLTGVKWHCDAHPPIWFY